MALIYGTGAALGYTPQEVDCMSIWQFISAVEGHVRANTAKGSEKLSESKKDDLWDMLENDGASDEAKSTMTYGWDGERLVALGRAEC